ncbi:hypothetical protein [Streptomyces sp. NPDC086989]|uniref:hypothetical protein n=1 Tax=Streptomyces sp. NPDC086989 TaxID=3365764 RepID=UPI0038017D49
MDDISKSTGRYASAPALTRAAQTGALHDFGVVQAFVDVCAEAMEGASATALREEARALWDAASSAAVAGAGPRLLTPGSVRNRGQLAGAMRRIALDARMSVRVLEAAGGRDSRGRHRLGRSTVSAAMKPAGTRLASPELLQAFLTACGVPAEETERWLAARERVATGRRIIGPRTARASRLVAVESGHPCFMVEQLAALTGEENEARPWERPRPDPDPDYARREREERRTAKSVGSRVWTDAEIAAMEAEQASNPQAICAAEVAHAELGAILRRTLRKDIEPDTGG